MIRSQKIRDSAKAKRKKKPTTSGLKKKAWYFLSQLIRQSAADHRELAVCYTCGKLAYWRELQAGHGIGGRHNAVLFDEEIIRPQCVGCNIFLRGNYQVFVAKLIRENGIDWYEQKLKDSKQTIHYTRGDLLERIESYKKRIAEVHAGKMVRVFDELETVAH